MQAGLCDFWSSFVLLLGSPFFHVTLPKQDIGGSFLAEYDFPMEMEVAPIGTVEPQTNIGSMEVFAAP
jgi:hypothetical protein